MVGKVRATRPPDKTNIREIPVQPVMLVKTAGVFQRFYDARHRDFIHGINAVLDGTLHRGQYRRATRWVTPIGKMIRQAKAAARRTNLPEHRRQRYQHPVFLLAELLALHSPAGHQHGGVFVEKSRQFTDFLCIDAANLCRPFGAFGNSIAFPRQVVGEFFKTLCTTGKEITVMPAVFDQRMGDPQHHRHVGTHMRSQPFNAVTEEINGFRAHRIDTN
ncbi:hypothetical protein D3C71_1146470 [compost metagenome]